MTDALDRLISEEIKRNIDLELRLTPIAYAVWIPGKGWLRHKTNVMFLDARRPVAETAAKLYGNGAIVYPSDAPANEAATQGELGELEALFLEQERGRAMQSKQAARFSRLKGLWAGKTQ